MRLIYWSCRGQGDFRKDCVNGRRPTVSGTVTVASCMSCVRAKASLGNAAAELENVDPAPHRRAHAASPEGLEGLLAWL